MVRYRHRSLRKVSLLHIKEEDELEGSKRYHCNKRFLFGRSRYRLVFIFCEDDIFVGLLRGQFQEVSIYENLLYNSLSHITYTRGL